MRTHLSSLRDISPHFWALSAFLSIVFLIGGGARDDVQSLLLLRPVSVFFLFYGLWGISRIELRANLALIGIAFACLLLVALQLVPLPPVLWQSLPGREAIIEADRLAGLSGQWRPLSMTPVRTWNALFSLVAPFTVLILMVRCTREEKHMLLPIVILFGLLSGFLGLLQTIGPENGPLYFYDITNNGLSVGLFANRNHQALILACLLPMLALHACTGARSIEQARLRGWLAFAMGAFLIPLLLVTGSRAGLLTGMVGLLSVALIYHRPQFSKQPKRKVRKIDPRYIAGAFSAIALAALTVILSRARAVDALFAPDKVDDLRFSIWKPILDMGWKYFPFGSGFGSFVEVYQVDEPDALLSATYVNHAHNDFLELMLTGGLPALLLLLTAIGFLVYWAWPLFRTTQRDRPLVKFGRLGAIISLMLVMASVVDYPLRTPSLMCLFLIAICWLSDASRQVRASIRS